jgi:hypothetical protein
VSETLPFERVLTYQEWVDDDPEAEHPSRLDVACPACGWVLRVVDDATGVGHWVYACPCGWNEFR